MNNYLFKYNYHRSLSLIVILTIWTNMVLTAPIISSDINPNSENLWISELNEIETTTSNNDNRLKYNVDNDELIEVDNDKVDSLHDGVISDRDQLAKQIKLAITTAIFQRNLFKQMDINGDNELSLREVLPLLNHHRSPSVTQQLALLFIGSDLNTDQHLNIGEFNAFLKSTTRAFGEIDRNDDDESVPIRTVPTGPLTLAEARSLLNSDAKNYSILAMADVNDDFRLSFVETYDFVDAYTPIRNYLKFLRLFTAHENKAEGKLNGSGFVNFLIDLIEQCQLIVVSTNGCDQLRTDTIDREVDWRDGDDDAGLSAISPEEEIKLATIMFIGSPISTNNHQRLPIPQALSSSSSSSTIVRSLIIFISIICLIL